MGCVASRFEQEEEVVSICRERKHQLKLAVERKYLLADAHYRYCQSLFGVSAAISFFVLRHSSPPSHFHITFPPPSPQKGESIVSNPLFLQQTPTESTKQVLENGNSCSSSSYESSEEDEDSEEGENEKKEQVCGYFYNKTPGEVANSPQMDFGWDFFNPFTDVTARSEVINVYDRISEEDLRVVREQEGIPDLEEEEECEIIVEEGKGSFGKDERNGGQVVKAVESANMSQGVNNQQEKGLGVIDTPVGGRELLEALKDIEDLFVRAYESGKDVSKMLECNRVHLQSNLEEIKESSTKIMKTISWRTASSRSSSCKSLVASASKSSSSSTWTEFSNDLFDDYGGMVSGSHSSTLGRLYAWEKKLYQDVKDGDSIRKLYERKCSQLRNQDAKGDESLSVDKTKLAVKDLYSRILVAIRSAETISNKIEKLIEEELEPQIMELLQGMTNTWRMMLEAHEIQNKIIFEVKTYTCPSYGKFSNESHRIATRQLEIELLNWRARLANYIESQKNYIEALHEWLSKFVAPEVEYQSRKSLAPPCPSNGPPLFKVCHDWLDLMSNLPDKAVSYAIRSCARDVRALWLQQGEEHQQKRKIDSLSKELDKKILAFCKTDNRFEFRLTDTNSEPGIEHEAESLTDRKDLLENLRRKVDLEKEKHQRYMQETERITLNGFQTGFCRVFESMAEFSRACLKMYNALSTSEKDGKPSCAAQIGENGGGG